MAHLAIKGHPTRGCEVIETLEMLGGKREGVFLGNVIDVGYYIDSNGYIDYGYANFLDNIIIYTLDEFLEKFPYKVGDKVVYEDKRREITNMVWEEQTNTVAYKLDDKLYCNVISELQLYKEETMKGTIKSFEITENYCTDEVKIEFDPSKYEMVKKENGYYVVKKQPQYPKTYEECCKALGLAHGKMTVDVPMHYSPLLITFAKLLICRDAYWKIAGKQMGLGKPWESNPRNEEQHRYAIYNYEGTIVENDLWLTGVNAILVFPTEEMRDAFLENFKELIKECINLL
jgi:hypothetical protein